MAVGHKLRIAEFRANQCHFLKIIFYAVTDIRMSTFAIYENFMCQYVPVYIV